MYHFIKNPETWEVARGKCLETLEGHEESTVMSMPWRQPRRDAPGDGFVRQHGASVEDC